MSTCGCRASVPSPDIPTTRGTQASQDGSRSHSQPGVVQSRRPKIAVREDAIENVRVKRT